MFYMLVFFPETTQFNLLSSSFVLTRVAALLHWYDATIAVQEDPEVVPSLKVLRLFLVKAAASTLFF